ncbi:hypothetical protein Tco_0161758 [Tanacetum coccineum]
MIDSQMDDMIKEKLALKEQVDSLEQNLSKQIKEKECLLQTFTVFKSESKEKEDKYMEKKIDLEKKIKELDNILFKVGQSAQTFRISNPTIESSNPPLVKVEVPSELPKLQDKDTTICKLKDIIKSMREKSKEENVNYDYCEIETKNVELENSMEKFLSENERLCYEINHVKQIVVVNSTTEAEYIAASNCCGQVESSKTSDSNTPVLSSTELKCSTSKCRSKLTGNKKNDRDLRETPSRT